MLKILTSTFIFTMLSYAYTNTNECTMTNKDERLKCYDDIAKNNTETIKIGKEIFTKCAGCHGAEGKTKALGKSEVIAGQAVANLVAKLRGYKAGTRNVHGMGMLMKGQAASLSDENLKNVAEYISSLGTKKSETKAGGKIDLAKKAAEKIILSDKYEYKDVFINLDGGVCGYIRARNRGTGLFSQYLKFVSYDEVVSIELRYGPSPMFDGMWYKACGKYLN